MYYLAEHLLKLNMVHICVYKVPACIQKIFTSIKINAREKLIIVRCALFGELY